jgi:hypothetical protein
MFNKHRIPMPLMGEEVSPAKLHGQVHGDTEPSKSIRSYRPSTVKIIPSRTLKFVPTFPDLLLQSGQKP